MAHLATHNPLKVLLELEESLTSTGSLKNAIIIKIGKGTDTLLGFDPWPSYAEKEIIVTWSRASTIIPTMIGSSYLQLIQ